MSMQTELKDVLSRYGLTPNKALGQNFLIDETVISRIADAACGAQLPILEVGPGLGALTAALLARGAHVTAVEKDQRLSEILPDIVGNDPRLSVLNEDILGIDIDALFPGGAFNAAGNLPYYITTAIAEKLLSSGPMQVTLMVQSEAAERFFAAPGARVYGPLAALSGAFYEGSVLFNVGSGSFYPVPGVTSTVLKLTKKDGEMSPPKGFLPFLNRAFSMRRKTLSNNLRDMPNVKAAIRSLGVPENVRAEALSPDALWTLYRALFPA